MTSDNIVEPAAKKHRTDLPTLNSGLYTEENKQHLLQSFQSSSPFTHVVLPEVCEREALIAARNELIENVEAKFKETDLFKVYQTGDLANMDGLEPELAAKLPTLMRIRNALYSQTFRSFVEEITALSAGTLTGKTDLSSNCYSHGGHLLCHDDVITTRRVSFILYLTDPDSPWVAEDGGALELYPLLAKNPGDPAGVPSASLLPQFNTMAMFTVQPGRSFHAIQEVYSDAKPRLSISGWFHGASPPPGAEGASLNQLKSSSTHMRYTPLAHAAAEDRAAADEDVALSASERELLSRWLNPTYLERGSLRKMVAQWEGSSCVQLHSFLREDVAAPILAALREEDMRDGVGSGRVPTYHAGVRGGWALTGPCHKQRYLSHPLAPSAAPDPARLLAASPNGCHPATAAAAMTPDGVESDGVALLLQRCAAELFASSAFAKWTAKITDLSLRSMHADLRRFRPGLDYTVAHGGGAPAPAGDGAGGQGAGGAEEEGAGGMPTLDATLCFVDDKDEVSAAAWGSDDLGGFQCYMLVDDEATAASETYKAEADDEALISCSAAFNTLNLLLVDPSLLCFVKFLSHDAPSSRYDIAASFLTDLSPQELAL